jgi:hypothetical protein
VKLWSARGLALLGVAILQIVVALVAGLALSDWIVSEYGGDSEALRVGLWLVFAIALMRLMNAPLRKLARRRAP